ncbi:MAG: peptidase C45 [Candidatus Hydrogenedentes bacterium]|nr:peptidase C45 [Candidatus Hydrogenedentota bacterium]
MKKHVLAIAVCCLYWLVTGCGSPAPAPESTPAAPTEKIAVQAPKPAEPPKPAPMNTSETAAKSESALAQQPPEAPERTLPADHWLNGAGKQDDTLDAVIAPEAPRKLLAQSGPAYLEQIGGVRVLHLKGSYHDMGAQHGTLLKEDILSAAKAIRFIGSVEWKKDFNTSLREAWNRTSPFIPEKYKHEIKGMAEATGMTEEEVQDFTIFPELFHCSGFAVWGKATADQALLHGRVLDYMRDAGLDRWAVIIIQEPEGANAFVNVGYSGTIGSVTGMNTQQVCVGEMGGSGAEKWDGMPMSLLVRECLESSKTLEDAQKIMSETKRTCEYYYVISDAKADNGRGSAVGVAATPEGIEFIHPNEAHARLPRPVEDAVLLSADDRYQCLVDRTQKMHGKITPQVGLDLMARGVAMRSNMHDVLFKPASQELWVANSTVLAPACNLPYTHLKLSDLMSQRPQG